MGVHLGGGIRHLAMPGRARWIDDMNTSLAVAVFVLGSVISLGTSWLLVSRIERIGARLSASEAMLGLIAALAANTPEISSAVSALEHGQQAIGVGVVIGSNVFNLAALLGLGAVVAGRIALHRRVVLLAGGVAIWVAVVCLLTVVGAVPPVAGVLLVVAVLVPYVVLAALDGPQIRDHGLAMRFRRWLRIAIREEELELSTAIHPRRGQLVDALVAVVALGVVVTASVAMERSASTLGARWGVSEIIVGGVVLAAVTSLPNAVAAIYLARRGRGAAMLSTALNSNALNVAVGFLLPAAVLGIGPTSDHVVLVSAWYVGLTLVALTFAYFDTGLRRDAGYVILASYLAFCAVLIATSHTLTNTAILLAPPILIVSTVCILYLHPGRNQAHKASTSERQDSMCVDPEVNERARPEKPSRSHEASLVPTWSVNRLALLALILLVTVAAVDAVLGRRIVLIGLLVIGPMCGALTGKWRRTAQLGALALGLSVLLGLPDGVWGTKTQFAFVLAVGLVTAIVTLCVGFLEKRGRLHA